ncbi:hypothetical protein [Sphingomonas chungangi]|uniref:hypothetical protein n=1 Tax=Sphingomonas chungangi TaxID=2683589 RepID=UPI003CCCD924
MDVSRSTPGHGLGLNLVAAVAAAHRGTVKTVPTSVGLTVEITMPPAAKDTSKLEVAAE